MNATKNSQSKFKRSVEALERALDFSKEAKEDDFYLSGISKSFEVCLEYAWKYFKRKAIQEGIEDVYSPREAIKRAGQLGLIDDVEKWLDFLEDRNLAVHDYLGISTAKYLKIIQIFLKEAEKVVEKF